MNKPTKEYLADLELLLEPQQLIQDISRRRAFGTDASFYQLVPALILKLHDHDQVQDVLQLSNEHRVAVTFRGAGTSLSGQAITDSVLILLSEHWRGHEILDHGHKIRLQPGVIGGDANRYLAPYGRKIGPDPASISACKIGGIAANNASGMCCGVSNNSYYTLADMTLILADGSELDSSNVHSVRAFRLEHSTMLEQLAQLGEQTRSNTQLHQLIEHKYRLKNTCGYAINALIDFTDPLDILMHLMVGSEGTLGFIADITYRTVVEHPHKASGLYLFGTADEACAMIDGLRVLAVDAVELMDQRALNSVQGQPGLPNTFCGNDDNYTALLIETSADSAEGLAKHIQTIGQLVQKHQPVAQIALTSDTLLCGQLWAIRKGTFPAVGAARDTGTTVIIEDVSFPLDTLATGISRLHELFDRFGYHEAIIFGHALAGNLHFVFTQSFNTQEEIKRYGDFMQALTQLVALDCHGSLKAEHGTGRNMAPFVELEWGAQAYEVMCRLKGLIDPKGILNPGVLLNADKDAHLKHLKPMPQANELIDKCTECGFCEPVCPSKDLSFSPRQRIVIWRRIQQLSQQKAISEAQQNELASLQKDFQYLGIDTCAATGLCAVRCPVGINTGDLIRQLRGHNIGKTGGLIAKFSAEHFAGVSKTMAVGLGLTAFATKALGNTRTDKTGAALHSLSGKRLPLWHSQWPGKAPALSFGPHSKAKPVIYFPSCASRTMGASADEADKRSLFAVASSVFAKGGYQLLVPDEVAQLCCGMPFSSKGLPDIAMEKGQQLAKHLHAISQDGDIPIVFDTSPCTLQMAGLDQALPIFDTSEFIVKHLLQALHITPQTEPVALHITCSSRKMGLAPYLLTLAQACAVEVIEPEHIYCCGFAGDKGLFVPELNASALSTLKQQIPPDCHSGYSNSRTCEIGLSHHAGIPYRSLLFLLDSVSQARQA
jgi:D-lactate dehydrogenase